MTPTNKLQGGCLCSSIRYKMRGPFRRVINCHCESCRKSSGHYVAATACKPENLTIIEGDTLTWYASSDTAHRGFCARCGSSLFFRPQHGKHVSVHAGTIDTPTQLSSAAHIFLTERSDYHTLADDLPMFDDAGTADVYVYDE